MSFDLSFHLQHTECIWIVLAPAGERIHMDVDRLDVKSSRRSFALQLRPSIITTNATNATKTTNTTNNNNNIIIFKVEV